MTARAGASPRARPRTIPVSSPLTGTFAPSFIKLAADREHAEATTDVEFGEKKWIWVRDDAIGFLRAWVVRAEGDYLYVRCSNDTDRTVKSDAVDKVNPPKFDKVQDMASLTYLNEPSVAYNLQQRYESGSIYTYSGLFLVAVNPYRHLPIYGQDTIESIRHRAQDIPDCPHVFATADSAYRSMLEMRESQSILITGESGAGKTENTKRVIQYLTAIAGSQALPKSAVVSEVLEHQVLQANLILEAFGNAQTVRNDNSSRFGKFIRIQFSEHGSITGAKINWFLLEKSRVASQSTKERNYHIFYQLLAGASPAIRKELLLTDDPLDYEYLKHAKHKVPGQSDEAMFQILLRSLKIMNISEVEQMEFFRIISAILHIGNLEVASDRSDQARLVDHIQVEKVCYLLGLQVQDFVKSLLTPRVRAGKEWVTNARSATQVRSSLAALARALYERNFGHLVDRINATIEGSEAYGSLFIGVLDMAGFEIFEKNSFEQLCINYTNEKLQQFFNHHMFVLEQDEYAREEIDWKFINFGLDLQPTIELIERSNPIGVLSCLDEECVMPRASDVTFTEKLHHLWAGKSDKYRPSKFCKDGFILKHYAAEVEYSTENWLIKNKDPLNENVNRLLAHSSVANIAQLFSDIAKEDETSTKKGQFRTVAQRHKEQLASLMSQLQSTQPHFVRCIIPNHQKSSKHFDFRLVLDQLRCNGVLEGIRIARTGFPNRLPFPEFKQRYSLLARCLPGGYLEGRKAAEKILTDIELDTNYYRIGLSKVFFRAGVLAELEEQREMVLRSLIICAQSCARAYLVRRLTRKRLHRKEATILLQTDFRNYLAISESPWWQLFTKMKPILSATRSDREMKMRSAEIQKLEALAKAREKASAEAAQEVKRLDALREELQVVLVSERATAADRDVLYERSREREAELQDELDVTLADVETLERRCDELLSSKSSLMSQIDGLHIRLEQATNITERLQKDKLVLLGEIKEREASLQREMTQEGEIKKIQIEQHNALSVLQEKLTDSNKQLEVVRKSFEDKTQQLEGYRRTSSVEVESLKRHLNSALMEQKAAKLQFDELVLSTTTSQATIRKRDSEIASTQQELHRTNTRVQELLEQSANYVVLLTSSQAQEADLQREVSSLQAAKKGLEEDLASLRNAEESLPDIAVLQAQLSVAGDRLQAAEAARLDDQKSHRTDLETEVRKSETHRMAVQKLEVINGDLVKQMAKSIQELSEVKKELQLAVSTKDEIREELKDLKIRLAKAEAASDTADHVQQDLTRRLNTAQEQMRATAAKASQVDVEKERFRREALDMRAKFDDLRLQRSQNDGSSKSSDLELQKTKTALKNLLADHGLIKDELLKSRSRLEQVNKLDEDLVATQVREVTRSKDAALSQLRQAETTNQQLEKEFIALQTGKSRFTKEVEDLSHELEKEHQIAKAAERMVSKLQSQLTESRLHLETERRQRLSTDSNMQKLQASLEIANVELCERSDQIIALHQAVSEEEDDSMGKVPQKEDIARKVDLAKELNAAKAALKLAESTQSMLRAQIAGMQLRQKEIQEFDAQHTLSRQHQDTLRTIRIENPSSTTKPLNIPWSPPPSIRSGLSEPGRSRTNTLAQNFENQDPQLLADATRSSDRSARRIQALQSEVDQLHKRLMSANINLQDKDLREGTGASNSLQFEVSRLTRENKRLHELLDDNADEIETIELAQRADRKFLKSMQTKSMGEIEETFGKLAEDRSILIQTQKKSLHDLAVARADLASLGKTKNDLETVNNDLRGQLQQQLDGVAEQAELIAQLQEDSQDAQTLAEAETIRAQELDASVAMYRQRAEEYFDRLEQAEATVIKATRAEAWSKKQWQEAEELSQAVIRDRETQDVFIIGLQRELQESESRLEDTSSELKQMEIQKSRIQQELAQYRDSKIRDNDEIEQSVEQTRKTYQRELFALNAELETERSSGVQLRDDYRQIRTDYEDLQIRSSESELIIGTLQKETCRKDNKIEDLCRELHHSESAQREMQSRVVNILSDIRELRLAKEELEAEREQLIGEKRSLESRVRTLTDNISNTKQANLVRVPASPPKQSQELMEQEELVSALRKKLQQADDMAGHAKREVLQERDANIQLHKQKVALENERKELQLKVVDLETQSFSTTSQDVKFLQNRIIELEKELTGQDQRNIEETRSLRSTDRTIKDLQATVHQKDSLNKRLEDKLSKTDARMSLILEDIETLREVESSMQVRARKAEREATDQRERALRAEKELERFRSREEFSKMTRSNTISSLNGNSVRLSPSLSSLSTRSSYLQSK